MDKWDVKQIMEAVSRGVNSFLMNKQEAPAEETIRFLAMTLKDIYVSIIEDLKKKVTEGEGEWKRPDFLKDRGKFYG